MHMPKLLVSVKNDAEVGPALVGGAEIIDIKNPALGSLGMATPETMGKIVEAVKSQEKRIGESLFEPVSISAAMGETIDRLEDDSLPKLPSGLSLVKMGTAGLSRLPKWREAWRDARNRIATVNDDSLRWVAVSYVDWERADAPSPEEVIDAAVETDCAGVLFDTFQKDERHLWNWLTVEELTGFIARIRTHNLFAACAGKVHLGILEDLMRCQPDVIAIRSAGCRKGIREGAIDAEAVRRFKHGMERICLARSNPL